MQRLGDNETLRFVKQNDTKQNWRIENYIKLMESISIHHGVEVNQLVNGLINWQTVTFMESIGHEQSKIDNYQLWLWSWLWGKVEWTSTIEMEKCCKGVPSFHWRMQLGSGVASVLQQRAARWQLQAMEKGHKVAYWSPPFPWRVKF